MNNKLITLIIVATIVLTSLIGFVSASIWDNSVSYYSFFNENQTTLLDRVDNNNGVFSGYTFNNGNLSGTTLNTSGKYGNAYTFDGNNDYIEATITNPLNTTFSISTWVYANSIIPSHRVIEKGANTDWRLVTIDISSVSFRKGDSNSFSVDIPLSTGTWTNIIITYNGTTIKGYKNGVYVTEDDMTFTDASDTITIGNYGGTKTYGWDGGIDEARIWNRALSQSEITQEMNSANPISGNGLVSSYSFEQNNATTTFDTNHLIAGKIIQGGNFDGVNDYIKTSALNGLDNSTGTYGFWFKANKFTTGSGISQGLFFENNTFMLRFIDNKMQVVISQFYNTTTMCDQVMESPYDLVVGTWYYYLVTQNSSGFYLYKNGILIDSEACIGQIKYGRTHAQELSIGAQNFGVYNFFNGSIDEVGIWNRSLSASEISQLYNQGAGMTHDVFQNTPAWNLYVNQTSNFNCSGTSNNIYLSNFSLFVNGNIVNTNTSRTNSTDVLNATAVSSTSESWVIKKTIPINNYLISVSDELQDGNFYSNYMIGWNYTNTTQVNSSVFEADCGGGGCWTAHTWSNPYPLVKLNSIYVYIQSGGGAGTQGERNTNGTHYNSNFYYFISYTIPSLGLFNWSCQVCDLDNSCQTSPMRDNYASLITYNSPVYETSIGNILINSTYNNTMFTGVSVNLIYDGTTYPTTLKTSGINISATSLMNIPLITSNQTKNFYFSFIFTNSSSTINMNSSIQSQAISPIYLTFCNSTYNILAINFSLKDEKTILPINGTFSGTFGYWLSGGPGIFKKIYSYTNISNILESFAFCIYPVSENFTTNMDADYSSAGYVQRSYYLRIAGVSNVTNNITLYLLDSSSSTSIILNIKDRFLENLKSHIVNILRYYPGTGEYALIETSKTDDFGNALAKLEEENVDYKFLISNSTGNQIYLSNPMRIICTATPCQLEFITGETEHIVQNLIDFANVEYDLSWNNNTGYVLFTFSDSSGLTQSMRLVVTKINAYGETNVCDNIMPSSAGILTCSIGTNATGEYSAKVYRTASPAKYFAQLSISLTNVWQVFGTEGLVWMFMFAVVMFFAGLTIGPAAAAVLTLVSIVFMMATGIVYIPLVVVISIAIVVIIFIIKMRS